MASGDDTIWSRPGLGVCVCVGVSMLWNLGRSGNNQSINQSPKKGVISEKLIAGRGKLREPFTLGPLSLSLPLLAIRGLGCVPHVALFHPTLPPPRKASIHPSIPRWNFSLTSHFPGLFTLTRRWEMSPPHPPSGLTWAGGGDKGGIQANSGGACLSLKPGRRAGPWPSFCLSPPLPLSPPPRCFQE